MGVISDLIRMKSEKDAAAKQGTIDALKLVMMPDSGATPEARNYAQTSLVNLLEGEFGGGGKGKSGGGGKDKAGVSGFFSHLLNGLGNINPYGASSGTKQQVSQIRQGMPSKMFLTDDEKEALRAKQAKIESDEKARAAAFQKQESDRVAREDNQQAYEQEYDRGVNSLNLSPADAAKRADEIVNKYKPAAAPKQSVPKAVTAIGPDGKTFTAYLRTDENGVEQLYKLGSDKPLDPTQYAQAEKPQQADASEKLVYTNAAGDEIPVFRDPHTNKMYDEAGSPVDIAALKLKGYKLQGKAEPRDTGELGQREEAEKILSDPSATKEQKKAATDTLKDLGIKAQGAITRIEVAQAGAQDKREQEAAIPETVEGIINGNIPPDRAGLGRNAGWLKIQAQLSKRGFNLARAELDWKAAESYVRGINSAQQIRLRETAQTLQQMIPDVQEKYNAFHKILADSGVRVFNKAELTAAKALPGKAGEAARALDVQIADMVSELGQTYMGGNSPTDHALELAQKNLSGDWNEEQFKAALDLLRKNLGYRTNAILNAGVAGSTENSPYNPPPNTGGGNASGGGASGGKHFVWNPQSNKFEEK